VCEKKINSYVWKCVVHGKDVCKQEHGKKLCVASTCSGIHGRISMTKLLNFILNSCSSQIHRLICVKL
jgi:hypothetical protein